MELDGSDHKQRRGENAARAYAEIRRRILDLELEPGSDLEEQSLAELFGVSRTPLREALVRLASEQLVVITPNRGAVVAPLTLTDFPAFIESLVCAQHTIHQLAALNATPADRAAIKQAEKAFAAAYRHKGAYLAELNRDYHNAIAAAAHNYHLAGFYARLLDESVRLAGVCFSYEAEGRDSHLDRVIDEHAAISGAITDGNEGLAGQLAMAHAKLFQTRILQFLSRNMADQF